jgi:hypothetical protein
MAALFDLSNGATSIDVSGADYAPAGAPFGLYVGGAGAVKIDTIETQGVTIQAIAGAVLPWAVRKVYQTGTTATGLTTIKLV